GFVAGHFSARRCKQQQPQENRWPCGREGKKRSARIRKSADKSAKGVSGPEKSFPTSVDGSSDKLTRQTRKRNKKLVPKDLALDAFARVASSRDESIGAGNYGSLLLLPRAAFIAAGRFLPYSDCQEHLVSLGQARAAMTGADELRILYVSCSWSNYVRGEECWDTADFETTRAFLQSNLTVVFVYVGRSCMVGDPDNPLRTSQLRHVPCVLMRADCMLILPPQLALEANLSASRCYRHSDFSLYTRGAWARMELALAAVGQAKVYAAFRAGPYPDCVCELEPGKSDVRDMVRKASDALKNAASSLCTGEVNAGIGDVSFSIDASTKVGTQENEMQRSSEALASVVGSACDNWLDSDLNPLKALEEARAVVTAAEKDGNVRVLESIRSMHPLSPSDESVSGVRAALGEEHIEGAGEIALCLLLFSVFCSRPKGRGTYTDAFVDAAAEMEITYRPIALVRSPYRERFGTPRQPQVTASVLNGGAQQGQIVFLKEHGYEEALQDLEGFDMIWVISHMHLNRGWSRKVRPPRLPEERKGLFSTRSPHRPNPVALSSLRVDRVDASGGVIYVHGLDLLDGTPVLDVKPYIG
ncbi:unnamed protein product, partial [Ascophyllum nodosum]